MRSTQRRVAATSLAVGLAAALAACGDDSQSADGPVTLEYWSHENGAEQLVEWFNESHGDITVEFVEQPGGADSLSNLRNAASGGNAPCIASSASGDLVSLVADQVLQDVTDLATEHEGDYAAGPWSSYRVQDRMYGMPTSGNTTFMVYNMEILDEYGIEPPTTWDEYLAAGEILAEDGIRMTNHAGEDPSGLQHVATQAGAHWYDIEGDAWKVDFLSADSIQGADLIQDQIDTDSIATYTYADYDAIMAAFDSGEIAARQISTWQLNGMQDNMDQSLGNWMPATLPEFAGEGHVTPAGAGGMVVTKDCPHPEAAVEFIHYAGTDPQAVELMSTPGIGSAIFPAVADPSPYVDDLVPYDLFGDYADLAPDVFVEGGLAATAWYPPGPNWSAMYEEMADKWAQVVTGRMTTRELLEHMQEWTVADLAESGVNVTE